MADKTKSKERILLAALKEFAQSGLAGARVDRIANAADANKQLIYYYFGSKEDLYEFLIERISTRWQAAESRSTAASSGPDAIKKALSELFERFTTSQHEVYVLLRDMVEGGGSSGGERVLEDIRDGLAATISAGQGVGHFRDDVEPRDYAWVITAVAIGDIVQRMADGKEAVARGGDASLAADVVLRALAW